MPTRDSALIGAPCWIDLMTSDPDRSREFYGELLGWAADEPAAEFGGYISFHRDGRRIAGCMSAEAAGAVRDAWSVYLAVEDIAKALEAVVPSGGEVRFDAHPVGDLGVMAAVADPGGAQVGLWQPQQHQGFGLVAEAGAPGWFELSTRVYEQALRFYREVFGWDTRTLSEGEFRYTVVQHGDDQVAGVLDASRFLPEGEPDHWTVYFAVEDTDAALAKAVQLGGKATQDPEDTPYGRIAAATDVTGAQFKLVGPNEAMPARDS